MRHPDRRRAGPARPAPLLAEFDRTKYGPEILADVEWVHHIPTYIVDRPHVLRFHEIVLVTRGSGVAWLDGDRYRIRPGTVLCTAPGQVRQWHVPGLDGLCLLFSALLLDQFFLDPGFLERQPFFRSGRPAAAFALAGATSGALRRSLLTIRREIVHRRPDSDHALRAIIYRTLVDLGRAHAARFPERSDRTGFPETVTRFQALVERHHATRHRVADYAAELAVSPGHLNVLCKRHLGVPAKTAIQDRVALQSRRLLMYTDEPAAGIARRLGFKNASYFSRHFRRRNGVSPRAFRDSLRQDRPATSKRVVPTSARTSAPA